MTCRAEIGGCGAEFCWLCRGPWSEHGSHTGGYYACNKYDTSDEKNEKFREQLQLYMFYYHRYEAHYEAMKLAENQKSNAQIKREEISEKYSVRDQDTQFYVDAISQLIKVLKISNHNFLE